MPESKQPWTDGRVHLMGKVFTYEFLGELPGDRSGARTNAGFFDFADRFVSESVGSAQDDIGENFFCGGSCAATARARCEHLA